MRCSTRVQKYWLPMYTARTLDSGRNCRRDDFKRFHSAHGRRESYRNFHRESVFYHDRCVIKYYIINARAACAIIHLIVPMHRCTKRAHTHAYRCAVGVYLKLLYTQRVHL